MLNQALLLSGIVSAAATLFIAVGTLAFVVFYLRDRTHSRYDETRHRAEISEIRVSYEAQLRNITQQLMATDERWKELNHLIISSQKATPAIGSTSPVESTRFLREIGVLPDEFVVDPKLIVMLMPFNREYDEVYEAVVSICRRSALNCVRGDEERSRGDILAHIIKLVVRARVIIAEITERNPNVYYELGMAHAMDKACILIARSMANVPFDLRNVRVVVYKDLNDLRSQLSESLLHAVASG